MIATGYTSFKSDNKAIGGFLLTIADMIIKRASTVYWKSKQIDKMCHSSKNAEMLTISRLLDDAI